MISAQRIKQILQERDLIPADILEEVIAKNAQRNVDILNELIHQHLISEAEAYNAVAESFGVEFVNLAEVTISQELLDLLPQTLVQAHEVVIFEKNDEEQTVSIATTDPEDLQAIDFIKKKTGYKPIVFFTNSESIAHITNQYNQHIEEEFASFQKPLEQGGEISAADASQRIPIIKMFDTLLDYAVFQSASDVHIEPTDSDVVVRFRIDGELRDVMRLPRSVRSGLLARIKILAHLKIDEHRLPQDGRITLNTEQGKVSVRVSILPVYDGEKVVMRILRESGNILSLEQLGFNERALRIVKQQTIKPHGMILVTGPTGSGKTTTLYTMMNMLNSPNVNISTVEDPIEYRMERVNQSQVNPKIGFTFASGLRALLRQDPNVIMVGEIRDKETAEIAAQAAMTGHLVLSTIHTNDSVSTVFRLSEMGVPDFLIASTLNVIIAQRLVRKLCQHCIESYDLSPEIIEELGKQFSTNDLERGLKALDEYIPEENNLSELHFFRSKGCSKCGDTGYKGRVGIYEVFEITEAASKAILEQQSKIQMKELAVSEGMMTMVQDGFIKAKRGLTSLEEILRVTRE